MYVYDIRQPFVTLFSNTDDDINNLTVVIITVLLVVNVCKNSIFQVLGRSSVLYIYIWFTGQIGMSPRDIASIMTEAVVEFAAKSPVHLHQITVCIYQPQMVQEFSDAVANKASSNSWQQTVKGHHHHHHIRLIKS